MNWVQYDGPADEHEHEDGDEALDGGDFDGDRDDFDCGGDDDGSRGFGGYGEMGDDDVRLYDNGAGDDFEPFDGLPDGMGPDGE